MRNMVVYRLPRSATTSEQSADAKSTGSEASSVTDEHGSQRNLERKEGDDREERHLLLHSVIALTEEVMRNKGVMMYQYLTHNEQLQGMKELDSLGKVKYILVPSPFHRLDALVYKQRYPEAKVIWCVQYRTHFKECNYSLGHIYDSPRSITKRVAQAVPVDAAVEDIFGQNLSDQGIRCYIPGGGLYIHGTYSPLPDV